jgi:hypothetical protein
VISVDTKKKELVGDFKNAGREWRPAGVPVQVRTHDFKDPALGKAIPYGIYDLANNEGWVSVGVDHDTAAFAVASIGSWWDHLGRERFPPATVLTITADCGGSNGNRTRLWKTELQRLADATGLTIRVCHFPPATSKWNRIEHRLFSFITINWRGKPLTIVKSGCYRNGPCSSPVLPRNPASRPGRYCIRLSRVFTRAVSSAMVCLVRLARDRFRCAQTGSTGLSSWA